MNLLIVLRLGIKTNLLKKIICWGRDEHWEHHPLVCWVCDYSAVAGKIQSGIVDSAGDIQSGYCQLYWGTCSAEERLCQPLGGEDSWLGIRFLWPVTKKYTYAPGNYSVWIHRPGLSTFKAILTVLLRKSSAKATITFRCNMFPQEFRHLLQTNW